MDDAVRPLDPPSTPRSGNRLAGRLGSIRLRGRLLAAIAVVSLTTVAVAGLGSTG